MNPLDYLLAKFRAIDPKIVAVAVGYLLTLAVVKLGLDINTVLIPGYLTLNAAIALAGGLVAGWWKSNFATVLRTSQEDGNPDPSKLAEAGNAVVGVLLTVLVAVLVYLILAAFIAPIVGIIGAIIVLIAGIPSGGFGVGGRWR